MEWSNLSNVIGKVAPVLGTLLGGPVGGTVGTLISTVLGVENNPDAVLNELKTNPESVLKLQELQLTHKEKLEELSIKKIELELVDLQNARNRQVESEKATGKKDYNLYVLAWTVVIGYFGLIFFLLENNVPEDKTGVVYMLFGTLATAFGAVMQYFFGSSAGSKQKAIELANIKKAN